MRKICDKNTSENHGRDRGSYTIEASLIFPLIMLFTIAFLLFAVAQWEKAALYKEATIIAEQRANTWDLSSKDLETGEFPLYITGDSGRDSDGRAKDGLYWRIFSDTKGSALTMDKLTTANDELNKGGFTGKVHYSGLPMRTVTVELTSNLDFMTTLNLPFFSDKITATATAHVAEPVQFMRNIDMAIYYGEVMDEVLKENNPLFGKFKNQKK